MFKKILTASVTAFSLFVIGCGTTDPESASAPTITGPTAPTTLVAGSPVNVVIEISAEDSIIYTGTIKNSAGTAVDATVIGSAVVLNTNKPKEKKITYTFTASATAPAGTYYLEIYATLLNGANATSKFNLVIAGAAGTPVVPSGVITLGAHADPDHGSSLDLDVGKVMFSAEAKADNSGADIVYTYASVAPVGPVLISPAYAKASSGITAFATWVNPLNTKFHKVTGVTFADITTDVALKALYSEALATTTAGRLNIAAGDLVVVLTNEGKYALVNIITVSADAATTATIKFAK